MLCDAISKRHNDSTRVSVSCKQQPAHELERTAHKIESPIYNKDVRHALATETGNKHASQQHHTARPITEQNTKTNATAYQRSLNINQKKNYPRPQRKGKQQITGQALHSIKQPKRNLNEQHQSTVQQAKIKQHNSEAKATQQIIEHRKPMSTNRHTTDKKQTHKPTPTQHWTNYRAEHENPTHTSVI